MSIGTQAAIRHHMSIKRSHYIPVLLALLLTTGVVSKAQSKCQLSSPMPSPLSKLEKKQSIGQTYSIRNFDFEINQGQFAEDIRYVLRGQQDKIAFRTQGAQILVSHGEEVVAVELSHEGANQVAPQGEQITARHSNYFTDGKAITNVSHYQKIRYSALYPGIDQVFYGNEGALEFDYIIQANADPHAIRMKINGSKALALSNDQGLTITLDGTQLQLKKPVAYQLVDKQKRPIYVSYSLLDNGLVGFELGKYDHTRPLIIDPILSYATFLGGSGGDQVRAIAADSTGNLYITGETSSSDFPVLGSYQSRIKGSSDAFVTKLDPTGTKILYSTYLGGARSATGSNSIAVDARGSAYIGGTTSSTAFPVTLGAYQSSPLAGVDNSFVSKLSPAGNTLVFSSYIQAAGVGSIAVDANEQLYVAGMASTGFKTTPGSYKPALNYANGGFVMKFFSSGQSTAYSTFFGGPNFSIASLAIDAQGSAYITGRTAATEFPLVSAFQNVYRGNWDAYVAKLAPSGSSLIYSSFLGGSANDSGTAIAVDSAGNAYVAGGTGSDNFPTKNAFKAQKTFDVSTGFLTKINSLGTQLDYSTFVGGNTCSGIFVSQENVRAITVDSAGSAYVAGVASCNFPLVDALQRELTTNPSGIPFVTKFAPNGMSLAFSTIIGARTGVDQYAQAIARDGAGNVYIAVTGTNYPILPVTPGAYKMAIPSNSDAYLAKFSVGVNSLELSTSANPLVGSGSVILTANHWGGIEGGTVTFKDGALVLGTAPLIKGAASLTTSLSLGIHSLTASYSGDGKSSLPLYQLVQATAPCN